MQWMFNIHTGSGEGEKVHEKKNATEVMSDSERLKQKWLNALGSLQKETHDMPFFLQSSLTYPFLANIQNETLS